jgi:oxygen-independent coproporphyrinogen-3 oxidase
LKSSGYLAQADRDSIALTRPGLLRVDVLLPRFFLPQHTGIRYT